MRLELLDRFARRHHGLVNRAAAAQLGVTRAAWYLAIGSGHLEQLYPNVARLWGTPPTLQQRALAAVWATRSDSMASHRTSEALWLPGRQLDDPIHITMADRARHSRLARVEVHRPRDLVDLRPILRDGVPTTNPLRMLVDLGADRPDAVEAAVIEVISLKLASPSAVRAALFRHARSGRNGVTPLRRALESWFGDELPPDTELEAAMGRLITAHRLPPVQFHAIVIGYEVDFLVVGSNIVIECDGWGTHGLQRDQFEFDRVRRNDLTAAGYAVAQVTWRRVQREPKAAAGQIREVIRKWAPHLLPRR